MIFFYRAGFLTLLPLCWIICISANAQPIARISHNGNILGHTSTITVCRGVAISFVDSSLNKTGIFWRVSSQTLASPMTATQDITFSIIRVDTIVLRADSTGIPSDSIRIYVNVTAPTSSFTFTNNNMCAGTNISFNPTSTGTLPFSYYWDFGGTLGAPTNTSILSPIVQFTPNNGYTSLIYGVTLQTTDANGCASSSVINNVTVKQLPDPIITDSNLFANPPFSNCTASPTTFNPTFRLNIINGITNPSLVSSLSINWGDGGSPLIISPSFSQLSHTYNSLGLFPITLVATNTIGCTNTLTYNAVNQSNPAIGLTSNGSTNGCAPLTLPFIISGYTNNSPGTYYIYNFDDGTPTVRLDNITNDTIWHTFNVTSCGKPSNQFVPKVTAYNACDSTTSTVNNVRVWTKPKSNFTSAPDTTICINSNITYTNQSTNGYFGSNCNTTTLYNWIFTGGLPSSSSNIGPHTVNYPTSGSFITSLITTNSCGSDTLNRTICVQPTPIPGFSFTHSNLTGCSPDSITFSNLSNTLTSCGNTTYSWTKIFGPSISFVGGTTSSSINPKILLSSGGTYIIRLSVTNRCGTFSKYDTIIIKGPPVVTLPSDLVLCDSSTIVYSNPSTSFATGGGTITSYLWRVTPAGTSFTTGTSSNSTLPSIFYPQAIATPISYMIISSATNECGTGKDTQIVTVNTKVFPPIVRDTFNCGPKSFAISGTIGQNGAVLKWYTSPSGDSVVFTGTPVTTPLINTTTSYYISSYNTLTSCESTRDTAKITINPIPIVPSPLSTSKCGPSSVSLSPIIGANGNNLKWYTNSSSGVSFFTGINYTTPLLSISTTYYVASFDSITSCESPTRSAITVTINPLPTVLAGNDTSLCHLPGTVSLPFSFAPPGSTAIWTGRGVDSSGILSPLLAGLGLDTLILTVTSPAPTSCVNKDSVIINIINATIPEAGDDSSVCKSNVPFTLVGIPSGGTWSGTNITSTGIYTPSTIGVFKVLYTIGVGSCQARDSLTITVNALPIPSFTLPSGTCPNKTILLSGSGGTIYKWSARNSKTYSNNIIVDSTLQSTSILFPENQTADTALYTIKLIVTNASGCVDSLSKSITLNRRPDASFTIPPSTCGPNTIATNNTTTPSTFTNWSWSSDSTSILFATSTSLNPQITFPLNNRIDSTKYKILLIATTTNAIGIPGCIDRDSSYQIIYPKPQASFTAITQDSCGPRSVILTNTSNAKNGESQSTLTNLWTIKNVNSTSLNSLIAISNTGVIDSIYAARLIVTSQHGCKDTIHQNITVRPNAKASFTYSLTTSCAPFNLTPVITAQTFPSANASYKWYANDSLIGTSNTFPAFAISAPNDSVLIKLVTTSIYGCKNDSMEVSFKTIANPVSGFTMSDSSGCSPLTVSFKNTSTIGVISYWTFSNGATAGPSNPFPIIFTNSSNISNSSFSAKLVITTGSGCKDSITKTITVFPKPKAIFSLPNNICADSIKTVSNSSLFKGFLASYAWNYTTITANTIDDSTLATPTFSFINNQGTFDTSYTIHLRVTSSDGCFHDTTKSTTILRRPSPMFSIPQPSCGPNTIPITNTTSNVPSNWNWVSNPALTFNTSSSQNPTVLFPVNTTNDSINYRILLTATRTGAGCTDTTSKLVTVYPKPQASFTAIIQDSCGPRLVVFTNTSNAKNGETIATLTNQWNINNANSASINNTATFSNTGVIDSIHTSRLIITSQHGCKDTSIQNITVRPNAKAIFIHYSNIGCAPFNLTPIITAQTFPNTNAGYKWYANDSLIGSISTFPAYSILIPNDSVLIKLVTTSLYGCKNDSMEVWFKTIPNPVPGFTMNDSIGCSPLTTSFTNTSTIGVTSNWTFSNGTTAGAANPFQITFTNPSNTTNITFSAKLVITTGSGCKDSITKTITVFPKPKSIFSLPNSICADSIQTASNSSLFKGSLASYAWNYATITANTINDTTLATPSFTFINNQGTFDSSYTISLRVTSSDGCFHDTTKAITILRRPLPIFTVPQPSCGPNTISITNTTSNVPSSWNWISSPGLTFNTSSSQDPAVLFPVNTTNDSINYRILLTATRTGAGCTDTTSKLVTVYPKPQANFTAITQDSCGPRLVVFTNTSSAENGETITTLTNQWNINDTNSASLNNIVTFSNTGVIDSIYTSRLVVTSQHGCKDTSLQNITVRPNAKAVFTFSLSTGCAPFNLGPIITGQTFPSANRDYRWYANNTLIGNTGAFPGYTILTQNDSVLVKLVTTSLNNCKDDSMEVWFKTIPNPVPNFTTNDSISCTPSVMTINNTSTPISGITYNWLIGTFTSTVKNPNTTLYNFGSNDTIVTAKLIVTAAGTGCKDSIEKPIIIKPLPRPQFSFSDTAFCFPLSISITNQTLPPPAINITGYKWTVTGLGPLSIQNDTASIETNISFPDNQSGSIRNYQISLKTTSDFGCIDSVTKTTKVASRPIANFNYINQIFCPYQNTSTNNTSQYASSYLWTPLSPFISISNTTSTNPNIRSVNLSSVLDSIFFIRLIALNIYGCKDSIVKPFTVNPQPNTNIHSDTNQGCAPLTISFNNQTSSKSTNTFIWQFEPGSNDTSAAPTHTFAGSIINDTTYLVSLITTSIDGCSDSTNYPITVKSSASAKLTTTDSIFCILNGIATVPIQNYSFGSVDSFFYDFGDSTYLTTTSDSSFAHNYINEGTYTVSVLAKNDCATSSDYLTFKVLKAPIPIFSLSDTLGCSPLKVKFHNTTISYESKYNWDFGNGITSSLYDPGTITFLQSQFFDTIYIVKLTASNACGIRSLQDTIRVLPIPISSFMLSTDSGCSPLPVSFLNTTTGLPSMVKWKFGNGDSSHRFQPYPVVYLTEDSATIYTIKLITSNMCGVDSVEHQVLVQPNSVRSFFTTTGATGCAPFTVTFSDYSVGGNNLSWNLGNGITSTAKNPTTTYTTPGKYNAYQYVNNGCSYDTSLVIINVLKVPDFSVNKTKNSACIGEQISFNSILEDSGSITWYWDDGDSSNILNPTHSFNTAGKIPIKIVMKSSQNSCPRTVFDTITINPLPSLSLNINTNQNCIYQSFIFNNNGSTSGAFFTWDLGDGNSSISNQVIHKYDSIGLYTVTLKGETFLGCLDSSSIVVRIFPQPHSQFSYTPKDTCTGPVLVKFLNESSGANSYLWDFGNGLNTNLTNPTITYASAGTYPISLIAGNAFGCFDTSVATYHVYNVPQPSFTFNTQNGCEPLTAIFTNTSIFGDSLIWYFGDGTTSNSLNPVHTYTKPRIYDVTLTVVEGHICSDSVTVGKAIEVYPKPVAAFDWKVDSTQRPYRFIDFQNLTTGAASFLWQFGDGKTSDAEIGRNEFPAKGCYPVILYAISNHLCIDTFDYEVCVPEYHKGLFVPNAFTPDFGRPEVRVFKPAGIELKRYHLKIFNKWGELIWETIELTEKGEPKIGWDGLDKNGISCMQGAYIWTIDATFTDESMWEGQELLNGRVERRGNVTLIR